MKIIFAILFFVITSIWVGLIFVFLKLLDAGSSTGKFIMVILAIACSMGLFFFLLSKYLELPASGERK
jgi:hypothetical protein